MSINIRFPNITGKTEAEQLVQVRSYLHQLAEQLNWALSNIQSGGIGAGASNAAPGQASAGGAGGGYENTVSFYELKSLIIKSADIVNSYYEQFKKKLEGEYVAISDFGTFTELTEQQFQATSTAIEQVYKDLQQIITDNEDVEHTLIDVNAHIKSGLLYYDDSGMPVYGVEIGQRTEMDGKEVFNKYARFTSEKLSFYDGNGIEVAYISDKKLHITHIEVTGSFAQGGFVDTTQSDMSVVTKWIGGGN